MIEPKTWTRLRRVGNVPVPWIVKVRTGKVAFGVRNISRMKRCAKERLCAVCGDFINGPVTFAGGTFATYSGIFNEPNMHEECLRASLQVCPYLKSKADDVYASVCSSSSMTEAKNGSLGFHAHGIIRVEQIINALATEG